jgi:small-conductance mechanosensitive channel
VLNPSVAQQLMGMADALARVVLPELPPGPGRDELRAAVGLTRRLARAVPQLGVYLHHDTQDLLVSLRALWPAADMTEPTHDGALAAAIAQAESLAPEAPPSLEELTATNLALRQALAELAGRADLDANTESSLRALLLRMAQREAEYLQLSPWARL